jgi:hypothetical protein
MEIDQPDLIRLFRGYIGLTSQKEIAAPFCPTHAQEMPKKISKIYTVVGYHNKFYILVKEGSYVNQCSGSKLY